MEGDKLIFTDEQRNKAMFIVNMVSNRFILSDYKHVISIGGESGTGKTEIAHILRSMWYGGEYHSISSVIVSIDDYYKTPWHSRNKLREEGIVKVGMSEINWRLLDHTIKCFETMSFTPIRRLNKYTGGVEWIYASSDDIDVLLIEGLYAHSRGDYRVKIKGSYKDTVDFRKLREKEKQTDFREKVLKQEALAVESIKGYDLLI